MVGSDRLNVSAIDNYSHLSFTFNVSAYAPFLVGAIHLQCSHCEGSLVHV